MIGLYERIGHQPIRIVYQVFRIEALQRIKFFPLPGPVARVQITFSANLDVSFSRIFFPRQRIDNRAACVAVADALLY